MFSIPSKLYRSERKFRLLLIPTPSGQPERYFQATSPAWPETSHPCRLAVGRIRETIARKTFLEALQDPLRICMYARIVAEFFYVVCWESKENREKFPVNLGRTISQMASRLFQRALMIESDAGVDHFGPPRCSTCSFHPTALTSQSGHSKRQLSCVMWHIAACCRCSTAFAPRYPMKILHRTVYPCYLTIHTHLPRNDSTIPSRNTRVRYLRSGSGSPENAPIRRLSFVQF